MRTLKKIIVLLILAVSPLLLVACGDNNNNNNEDPQTMFISDYTLPENFVMTLQLSDTSIFNPGNPWYFKTAKIGNDWQIIEYDRNLGTNEQVTHFFKYISTNQYNHYTYNYKTSSWVKGSTVNFQEMVRTSNNNFLFLEKADRENPVNNATTTNTTYDVDPTSIETYIDAIKYEFTNVLEYEEVADAVFTDMTLSHISRDGSTICYAFRAYEYTKEISNWDSSYLSYRNYKTVPIV